MQFDTLMEWTSDIVTVHHDVAQKQSNVFLILLSLRSLCGVVVKLVAL